MFDFYKVLFIVLYVDFFKIRNWKFLFLINFLKKNNFLKKSIREGNGRDLEEMDFLLLKFYVIDYYIFIWDG